VQLMMPQRGSASRQRHKATVASCLVIVLITASCKAAPIISVAPSKTLFDSFKTKTADGWELSLFRYTPERIDPKKRPVVLCHGFSYNNYFWDVDENHSLARYLARNGYDVWTVSLRGAGRSTKPGLTVIRNLITTEGRELPHVVPQITFDFTKINWTIDDYIMYDVPAVLDFVTSKTGSDSVHWIGHSMGGMLMYGCLDKSETASKVRTFVAISSPATFPHPLDAILQAFTENKNIMNIFNLAISNRLSAFLGGATGAVLETPLDTLFYNRENIQREVIRKMFLRAAEDISPGVLDQMLLSVEKGYFVSADGKTDYRKAIANIRTPSLFLVGKADNLALPESVRFAYRSIPAKDKKFTMVGIGNGFSADYGHNDIILGVRAPQEVYPRIKEWLDSHP